MSLNMPDFYKQPSSWKNLKLTLVQVVPAASSLQGFFFMTQNAWEELWVLSCFLWEADDLSGFFSLRSIPPPKKKRENQGKIAEPICPWKKWWYNQFSHDSNPLGPWKSLQKLLHRTDQLFGHLGSETRNSQVTCGIFSEPKSIQDGQLENPGEIWSEKIKRYNNLDLPVLKCRKKCVNSPWHLRGFPLATQLEGAGLQNYTLAPCPLLPAVHSRQKEKKQKEGDTYHLGCSRHRIHHSDHFYLRLGDHNFNPHFHHWHLARRNSHMPKFVPSEKYSHVDMLFPGGVKMTKEYKRPLKPPFIVDMLNVLGCSPFLRSIFLLTTQWLPFHHFCPRIRFSHPSL